MRRLTELGLSLSGVRCGLANDAGRELTETTETLEERDADQPRQEAHTQKRRCRLDALLTEPPGATEPVSPRSPHCWHQPPNRFAERGNGLRVAAGRLRSVSSRKRDSLYGCLLQLRESNPGAA